MTTELMVLALSVVLGIIQLLVATQFATKQRGVKWNVGPRDENLPELKGLAGRLDRASKNFQETFPFFATAILIVHVANRLGPLSTMGAELYLAARVIYIPLYAMGIPVIRSLAWLCSLVGICLILSACFWS